MNGPVKMYGMRKIIDHGGPVALPNVMYKMKNIHSSRNGLLGGPIDHATSPNKKLDIFDQVKQFLKNNQEIPGMAELVIRQEEILKQLAELKKQICSMKADLKISNTICTKQKNIVVHSLDPPNICAATISLPDILINVNPTRPPYALEVLQRLLSDDVSLVVTSHLHSTVSNLPDESERITKSLVNFCPKPKVPVMNVRLIWKDVDSNVELLVSHLPILHEVNLVRYLSRVITTKLSYDSDDDCVKIDSLLDSSYLLTRTKTKTEKNGIIDTFSKSLLKGQYLLGRKEIGVADVAAYSAIRQCGAQMNVSLSHWYRRVGELVN